MIKKSLIKRYIELSLNPVPVKKGTKVPIREKHTTVFTLDEVDKYNFEEIGISTGYASMNLEALDFDLKNTDNPDEFIISFENMIPEVLLSKLVISSTPSGGRHYIYRCKDIEANQKLARNMEGAATIETRGIGGYIKCYPSEGYSFISEKKFNEIPYITVQERNFLLNICRQKDKLAKRDIYKKYSTEDLDHLKKFPDFNKDPDVGINLLKEAGWTYHSEHGEWYNMTRPDSESGELHGGYNTEGMFFQTFSTAQDVFEERRGYNNHHIYAELICDGNYKKAYRQLFDQGFGVDEENEDDEKELSFISNFESENEYLEQARKGEIPLGVSLGWSKLDDNFRLKKNQFYFFLGLDNIGKSTIISSMQAATKVLYNYKWGISSPEAMVEVTRRNLIEAEIGKKIDELDKDTYNKLLINSRDYFYIINNDKHYTIDEILKKGRKLYQRYGIDFFLIDPFSFYSGSGNFSEDNEILSKIRVFCQNYCSVIVIDHPYTGFTRVAKGADGFLRIPTKYDASGGNAKANRCDDFVSFHRIINHPDIDIRKTMQISVQKVKDKSTGGKPHASNEWSELIYERRDGFLGYWDIEGNNPMYQYLKSKEGVTEKLKYMTPEEAF